VVVKALCVANRPHGVRRSALRRHAASSTEALQGKPLIWQSRLDVWTIGKSGL
jgi:hypothetical protein